MKKILFLISAFLMLVGCDRIVQPRRVICINEEGDTVLNEITAEGTTPDIVKKIGYVYAHFYTLDGREIITATNTGSIIIEKISDETR